MGWLWKHAKVLETDFRLYSFFHHCDNCMIARTPQSPTPIIHSFTPPALSISDRVGVGLAAFVGRQMGVLPPINASDTIISHLGSLCSRVRGHSIDGAPTRATLRLELVERHPHVVATHSGGHLCHPLELLSLLNQFPVVKLFDCHHWSRSGCFRGSTGGWLPSRT
jgi:hypothetical protein